MQDELWEKRKEWKKMMRNEKNRKDEIEKLQRLIDVEKQKREGKTPKDLLKLIVNIGEIRVSDASKTLGLPIKTVDKWANALEKRGLIRVDDRYLGNPTLRIRQSVLDRLTAIKERRETLRKKNIEQLLKKEKEELLKKESELKKVRMARLKLEEELKKQEELLKQERMKAGLEPREERGELPQEPVKEKTSAPKPSEEEFLYGSDFQTSEKTKEDLVKLLKQKGEMTARNAAREIGIDEHTVLEWVAELELKNIVSIKKKLLHGVLLNLTGDAERKMREEKEAVTVQSIRDELARIREEQKKLRERGY